MKEQLLNASLEGDIKYKYSTKYFTEYKYRARIEYREKSDEIGQTRTFDIYTTDPHQGQIENMLVSKLEKLNALWVKVRAWTSKANDEACEKLLGEYLQNELEDR